MTTTICHIPPANMTCIIPRSYPMHLCVADVVVKQAGYRAYYREASERGAHVIVDSAAFEGHITDTSTLADAARAVRAQEVVLTDDPSSAFNTLILSRRCATMLRGAGFEGDFIACPHGFTVDEYVQNVLALARIDGVTTLGIVEEIPELLGIPREKMILMLNEMFPNLAIHLLGVTEQLTELRDPVIRPLVRSTDTAKLIVWGLNDIVVDPGAEKIPTYPGRDSVGGRLGYFGYETDDALLIGKARHNILLWREYLECAAS